MSTRDFQAGQIRTSKLIASQSQTGVPSLLVYSASNASDFVGSYAATMVSDVGSDVFIFVSGSISDPSGLTATAPLVREKVVLFGGDVVISGTMYAERSVIEIDGNVTGSMIVSGNLIVSQSGDFKEGLSVNTSREYSSEDDENKFVVYGGNPGTDSTIGDKVGLYFSPFANSGHGVVRILSGGHGESPDESRGEDVNFYVSGSVNRRETGHGTSLFGGDLVTSGNVYVDGGIVSIRNVDATPASGSLFIGKWINPGSVMGGEMLGSIKFGTDKDGVSGEAAVIEASSQYGSWSVGTSTPGELRFKTTAVNSTEGQTRLTITNDGDIAIGESDSGNEFTSPKTLVHLQDDRNPDDDLGDIDDYQLGITTVTSLGSAGIAFGTDDTTGNVGASIVYRNVGSEDQGDLILSNKELTAAGSDPSEKIRLSASGSVLILSGNHNQVSRAPASGGKDPDPKLFTDTNFWVSGSIGTVGSSTIKGTSVFAGDVVVSGSLYTNENQLLIMSGASPNEDGTDLDPAQLGDVNFWVSGSTNSKGLSTNGTALFGGDLVTSGSFYGQTLGTRVSREQSSNNDDYWIKVAEIKNTDEFEASSATFLITWTGWPTASNKWQRAYVHCNWRRENDGPSCEAECLVDVIDNSAGEIDKDDFVITYAESAAGGAELWARAPARYTDIFVSMVGGSHDVLPFSEGTYYPRQWIILTDQTWYENYPSLGFDRTGEYVERIFRRVMIASGSWGSYPSLSTTVLDVRGSETSQILLLSGTSGHADDPEGDAEKYTDTNFFVSGTIGSKDSADVKGTSAFGGDVHISGNLSVDGSNTFGWVDDGTVVRLSTATDGVNIGAATQPVSALEIRPGYSDTSGITITSHETGGSKLSGSLAFRSDLYTNTQAAVVFEHQPRRFVLVNSGTGKDIAFKTSPATGYDDLWSLYVDSDNRALGINTQPYAQTTPLHVSGSTSSTIVRVQGNQQVADTVKIQLYNPIKQASGGEQPQYLQIGMVTGSSAGYNYGKMLNESTYGPAGTDGSNEASKFTGAFLKTTKYVDGGTGNEGDKNQDFHIVETRKWNEDYLPILSIVSGSSVSGLKNIGSGVQVLVQSGSSPNEDGTDLDPQSFTDTNFWVSGSISGNGGSHRGTAVFGGDTVVSGVLRVESNALYSGSLYLDDSSTIINASEPDTKIGWKSGNGVQISLQSTSRASSEVSLYDADSALTIGYLSQSMAYDNQGSAPTARHLVLKPGTTAAAVRLEGFGDGTHLTKASLAAFSDHVLVMTGGLPTRQYDTNFFVSGSIFSKDSATDQGTAVFGGDVVISGVLHGGSPLKIGSPMQVTGAIYLKDEDSAPSVESSGESVIYSRTGKLYWKNAGGSEEEVGTGGGGASGEEGVGWFSGSSAIHGDLGTQPSWISTSGSLAVSGSYLDVEQYIRRIGESDTLVPRINFHEENNLRFEVSGSNFTTPTQILQLNGDPYNPDYPASKYQPHILFNGSGKDFSFGVVGAEGTSLIHASGTYKHSQYPNAEEKDWNIWLSGSQVLILSSTNTDGTDQDPASLKDMSFFVSGAVGGKNSTDGTKGTSVFGGDTIISGVLVVGGENFHELTHATVGGSISGSIHHTSGGVSYLVAGDNVTITSASNGQITISSVGGGGGSGEGVGWIGAADGIISTTGSVYFGVSSGQSDPDITFGSDGAAAFNVNNSAVDFRVSTDGKTHAIFADGNINQIVLGAETSTYPLNTDTGIYLSGTMGSLASSTSYGAVVIAGDLLASGSVSLAHSSSMSPDDLANVSLGVGPGALSLAESTSDVSIWLSGSSPVLGTDYSHRGVTVIGGDTVLSGSIVPGIDSSYDLGTSENRWRNVYTGDLHLKNDRGDWTILEEEDYLCVINNKTGKKFKMVLESIDS